MTGEKQAQRGIYIVVSAPSGTGKTSICRQVLARCPNLRFSVSHTTRPARRGEVHGRDYHFVTEGEFRAMVARDEFVEWTENYGHLYGTSFRAMEDLLSQGFDVIVDVEPGGAQAIRDRYPGGVFVFILPPSLTELRNRLSRRGGESPSAIEQRFAKAREEIGAYWRYDYIIINDELPQAVSDLYAIYTAETMRTARMTEYVQKLIKSS
ncbi:MAG: guanylate kinase [Syntrophales bacterium]|nr:guanylate kinase [Syntrophales bacterium]